MTPSSEDDTTTGWSRDELDLIGGAEEIQIASRRPDSSLTPYVTIWTVHTGGDVYVRSAYGSNNGWFRRALRAGAGRLRAGDVERDVQFETPADADIGSAISAAYHLKYDRYGAQMVGTVTSPEAARATLRVRPARSMSMMKTTTATDDNTPVP